MSEINRDVAIQKKLSSITELLFMEIVPDMIREATSAQERIPVRDYDRLIFNCREASIRFACAMSNANVPEGSMNVEWDKINAKVRG